MAQQINVEILVKNQKISPFTKLIITQSINNHHYFELRFNHDIFEENNAFIINRSKSFLGEEITISFSTKHESAYPDNIFKAIITEIDISNDINSSGDLIFRGYSPTILMEEGPNNASHSEKNLSQIVKATISHIAGNLMPSAINPSYNATIPYLVQYKETDFQFVRRIAAEYGEWFFYDGTKFCFGKPSTASNVELKYPRDITNISLKVRVSSLSFEQTGYYSKDDTKLNSRSDATSTDGLDTFGNFASAKSKQLYNKAANALSIRPVQSKNDLDNLVTAKKSSHAAGLVCIDAASDCPYIKPGCTVTVTGIKPDKSSEDFGKYTITSVIHTTDGLGNYTNNFEGIPATLKVFPNQHFTKPIAEPQLGIVKNLNDRDNLGRVKVQLLWQKDGETTPFIRVMMPHAGLRNGNKKNRGAFFTPEVGDYVIVGFSQNDPDRPFVMGSVPHGKAINTSMNSDNNAKAIRTRSGNTIYFFDNEKKQEQEIKIETDDKNYVSILLKTGKGTISIHTNDTIDIKSDKVINITSNDININAHNNITIKAGKDISIKAGKNLTVKSMKHEIEASQSLEAKSMSTKIEGSVNATVKGTQLSLEGAAIASLKAAMVKIN